MNIDDCFDEIGNFKQDKFIQFLKIRGEKYTNDHLNDIEYLINRIVQNMVVYEDNINVIKSDYLDLISLLIKKGVVYKQHVIPINEIEKEELIFDIYPEL